MLKLTQEMTPNTLHQKIIIYGLLWDVWLLWDQNKTNLQLAY